MCKKRGSFNNSHKSSDDDLLKMIFCESNNVFADVKLKQLH